MLPPALIQTRWRFPAMTVAAAAALAWGSAALAQTEQWLEYHTSPEPMGYRWLELSTNPPPNVALPRLQPTAYYGRWTNGLETTGGRWFCVDRSRRSGPCDRLFFDANGNGRLDDDPAITTTRRDENMSYFEPVKLVFKGEDGPISYHLAVRYYQFDQNDARLLVGAGGWYGGQVNFGGKKQSLQLQDNTANATFNDIGEEPDGSDRITVGGEQGRSVYLGRYLELDGQLYQIEVARDGAFVKVKPAEGVASGTVRVPESVTEFTAVGPSGHFVRKPAKGEFKLPAGKYRAYAWEIARKDDKGAQWTMSGYSSTPAGDFTVAADQVTSVAAGEPVLAALQITEVKTDLGFSLSLLGPLGESVQIMRGTERPRAPQLQVAGVGFSATRNFEYG